MWTHRGFVLFNSQAIILLMSISSIFELNKRNLNLFGWLSIVPTIILIPYFIISFVVGITSPDLTQDTPFGSIINIAYTLIFISIFYFFKVLLNKKYKFFNADKIINAYIFISVLSTAGLYVLEFIHGAETLIIIYAFGSLVPLGILNIALGIKLLAIDSSINGIKKALSINLITSGILFASVVLFLFAIIPSFIANVLLGVIFLREAAKIGSPND